MKDKNSDLLFEYLRSILYDSSIQSLDISNLDEPFQKLGLGLQYLEKAVTEMKQYSAALSIGNLSAEPPSRENFLCENLKNIHANLNHLTWQAKQVAKGDYSQTVSYLGEFSEAFNTMTHQLREREESLKQEAEVEKMHANMLESYNQLLIELIDRSDEEILVTRVAQPDILYHNTGTVSGTPELYAKCLAFSPKDKQQQAHHASYEWVWETECDNHFYRIVTGYMEWQGQRAYAHIIREITNERVREQQLQTEANQDALTEIGNRLFFSRKMEECLASGEHLILCYCDLDHLKYVNDKFGHAEGDRYLQSFVDLIKRHIRSDDVFARIGGDEFCIILRNCPRNMAEKKMQTVQQAFADAPSRPYPASFSCGIIEVMHNHEPIEVSDIIQQADHIMYEQKRIHKQNYTTELQ